MMWLIVLLLTLLDHQNYSLTSALLVKRYESGDIFQNLGSGATYCSQRGAQCSALLLEDNTPQSQCSVQNSDVSCPSCACNEGGRFNNELDTCGKLLLNDLKILLEDNVIHYHSNVII